MSNIKQKLFSIFFIACILFAEDDVKSISADSDHGVSNVSYASMLTPQ